MSAKLHRFKPSSKLESRNPFPPPSLSHTRSGAPSRLRANHQSEVKLLQWAPTSTSHRAHDTASPPPTLSLNLLNKRTPDSKQPPPCLPTPPPTPPPPQRLLGYQTTTPLAFRSLRVLICSSIILYTPLLRDFNFINPTCSLVRIDFTKTGNLARAVNFTWCFGVKMSGFFWNLNSLSFHG